MHWHKNPALWLATTAMALLAALVMVAGILNASRRAGIGVASITPASLASRQAVRQLHRLANHPDVRAIVLDIRCPSSPLADMQSAAEEILKIRRQGKPVVAAIADQAAGSGYYVACCAELIFANPGSLIQGLAEGSLPSATPAAAVADLKEQVFGAVLESRSVRMAEVLAVEKNTVTTDIAPEAVMGRLRALLDGPCLTGRQAWQAGLVDRLGNLDDAIAAAAVWEDAQHGRGLFIRSRESTDSPLPPRQP